MGITNSGATAEIPTRKVPAAKIQFLPEDRVWIAERIQEVLSTGQLTLGKYGAEFEQKFAQFCGTRHAIAVNSGTSSLEIILRVLGVEGKDVLVPTNTFFATAAAVIHAGGHPVLVDMDPESFAVRPEDLEKRLTSKTAGVIVVHIAGIVSRRLPELQQWAAKKGLWLVEDAAHAHGSSYKGVRAGAFGIRFIQFLSHEGHDFRRRGHDCDQRRSYCRRSEDLSRSGQGRLHAKCPYPHGVQLADV